MVGLAGTALTYVGLRGCEMLKGTESCGAPGLGLLVVIIVLMMLGGALLLSCWASPSRAAPASWRSA